MLEVKRSEVIFLSVLVLSILVLAACVQVGPGQAVVRKQAIVAEKPTAAPAVPICAQAGQTCGPSAGNQSCCAGLNCQLTLGKIWRCATPPSCTPATVCYNSSHIANRLANCSYTNILLCPYGCNASTNLCNPAPGCAPTCFDSDGGINLNVTGNVSGIYGNDTFCTNYFFQDGCGLWSGGSQQVNEWYCVGGQFTQGSYNCPSGQTCVSGHCQ